jgi:hypothetical protein
MKRKLEIDASNSSSYHCIWLPTIMLLYLSRKRMVLFLSGIMAAFGISVSIIIIAVNGGFSGPGPSLFNPPTTSNLWAVGGTIRPGIILNYSLTRIGPYESPWSSLGGNSSLINSFVSMQFAQDETNGVVNNNDWKVLISIINGTKPSTSTTSTQHLSSSSNTKQGTVFLSKQQLTNAASHSISQDFIPYYEPIESSILEIRDIALEPEYLVVGAQWNSISVNIATIPVKVIAQEKIQTNAGTFNSFVLAYSIGSKTSRIWIDQHVPLPIKAQVYNTQNQLQYEYTLVSYRK